MCCQVCMCFYPRKPLVWNEALNIFTAVSLPQTQILLTTNDFHRVAHCSSRWKAAFHQPPLFCADGKWQHLFAESLQGNCKVPVKGVPSCRMGFFSSMASEKNGRRISVVLQIKPRVNGVTQSHRQTASCFWKSFSLKSAYMFESFLWAGISCCICLEMAQRSVILNNRNSGHS